MDFIPLRFKPAEAALSAPALDSHAAKARVGEREPGVVVTHAQIVRIACIQRLLRADGYFALRATKAGLADGQLRFPAGKWLAEFEGPVFDQLGIKPAVLHRDANVLQRKCRTSAVDGAPWVCSIDRRSRLALAVIAAIAEKVYRKGGKNDAYAKRNLARIGIGKLNAQRRDALRISKQMARHPARPFPDP